LGENLTDRKWVAQILGYAAVAGVAYCVLTDGDHYRFYDGVGIALKQIINAGLLPTPLALSRKYKGKVLQAMLHADGSIEFQGQRYATCSTAAEHARGT